MDISQDDSAQGASDDGVGPLILLTGATGYIGGRLLNKLEEAGYRVRCLTRRPDELQRRVGPRTEAVHADMLDSADLNEAMSGGDVAFYLVHSMGLADDFEERDRVAAKNFGDAARRAGVGRIIYLGGLGEGGVEGSPHLRSRQEVGNVLRESGVEVIEFRAAVVLGSGSLSFEMVRALVERLPAMVTPRWVSVLTQPIGVTDLLAYLMAAIGHPTDGSRTYQIGGTDQVSYGDLMAEYARQRGLKRLMIPVPFLTPRLSSLWLGLVTPLYARVGRKLIESLRVPTVVTDDVALREFDVRPDGVKEAIAKAIRNEDKEFAATRWNDALSSSGEPRAWSGARFGSRLIDSRSITVSVLPKAAFRPIERIGGGSGWYYATWLWKIRGILDLLAGGPGLRRGRRDPVHLRVGDAVDWWRVEEFEQDRLLRLKAEMRLSGRAWLEFQVEPEGTGSKIRQTAIFDPVGLRGIGYWYASAPFHYFIFGGMLARIGEEAEAHGGDEDATIPTPTRDTPAHE